MARLRDHRREHAGAEPAIKVGSYSPFFENPAGYFSPRPRLFAVVCFEPAALFVLPAIASATPATAPATVAVVFAILETRAAAAFAFVLRLDRFAVLGFLDDLDFVDFLAGICLLLKRRAGRSQDYI